MSSFLFGGRKTKAPHKKNPSYGSVWGDNGFGGWENRKNLHVSTEYIFLQIAFFFWFSRAPLHWFRRFEHHTHLFFISYVKSANYLRPIRFFFHLPTGAKTVNAPRHTSLAMTRDRRACVDRCVSEERAEEVRTFNARMSKFKYEWLVHASHEYNNHHGLMNKISNNNNTVIDKCLIRATKLTTGFLLSTRLLGARPSIKTTLLKEPASHFGAI